MEVIESNEVRPVLPGGPRIGLLESQRVVRDSFARALTGAELQVVFTCASAEEFLDQIAARPVQVAIVAPPPDGDLEAAEKLWRALSSLGEWYPETKILVLSGRGPQGSLEQALGAGAAGFLDKQAASFEDMVGAIRALAAGERLFPIADGLLSPNQPAAPSMSPALQSLTEREREVLRYIAGGADNLKIAAMLEITERTVRAHVSSLYKKLGPENRAQLALLARKLGLRPPATL